MEHEQNTVPTPLMTLASQPQKASGPQQLRADPERGGQVTLPVLLLGNHVIVATLLSLFTTRVLICKTVIIIISPTSLL